jgi:alpha-beta hydrolase superfamily lysophospholipase
VAPGIRLGARYYLADRDAANILFFHGNGEIAEDYDPVGPIYNQYGLSFLVVDYRGYGRSDGQPRASTLLADAHAVFEELRAWLAGDERGGRLIVMGRSLGSACAVELAAAYGDEISGLIIESGFSQTLPLLRCLGGESVLEGICEEDGFCNLEKIERVTRPTLIMHGQRDQVIPIGNAELLQVHGGARGKEFHMIPGADHNTVMLEGGHLYFDLIRQFVDKVEGKKPKRKSFKERRLERRGTDA